MTQLVALLTDFGITDTYVGVMKGVMLNIAPGAQLIDLTHAVQPQSVKQAAFLLLNSYRYFPRGTVFLVVVDPGVGSERRALAVRAGDYTFVAPDNGVLSGVLRELGAARAVELRDPAYRLSATSVTFHGRDIFAPAAAHLAAGVAIEQLGSPVEHPVELPAPLLTVEPARITGEVLHVDHFGTAVTSIGLLRWIAGDQLALQPRFGAGGDAFHFPAAQAAVSAADQTLIGIARTYTDVPPGESLALVGSSGYLELSVNQGSFARRFGVQVGDAVEVAIG